MRLDRNLHGAQCLWMTLWSVARAGRSALGKKAMQVSQSRMESYVKERNVSNAGLQEVQMK